MVDLNASLVQEKILDLAKQYGSQKISLDQKKVEFHSDTSEEKRLKEELMELATKYNHEMKRLNTNVSFNYDDTLKGLLVIVRDKNTEQVIREIPSREAIELMKKMRDLVGAIFDKQG